MATEAKLPRLGQGMEAATIVRWLKVEGDTVKKGEPLYEVDTDKVTQEVEAEEDGVLLRIAVEQGDVPVGRTIALIGVEGEVVGIPGSHEPGLPLDTSLAQRIETPTDAQTVPARSEPEGRLQRDLAPDGAWIRASPRARRIARERGIPLVEVHPSAPQGRIVAEDVKRAAAAAPRPGAAPFATPDEIELVALTNIRRTIARRLTDAWEIPVFQLTVSADITRADDLVAAQRRLNPGIHVTITDVLSTACARALVRHRGVNAQFSDGALQFFHTVNIGIAVAASHGLVVVVLRSVERLSLVEVAQARAAVVQRARDNRLAPADLEDGTFTISNLGMFDIEQFVAVINPPQAAILAVGKTELRPVGRDGALALRPMMTMTLTVDHRAVDGAEAAEFLGTLKAYLEDPALTL